MTSNETAQGAYKTGEYAITKQDLTKAALSIGALGMEFSWTYANQMGLAFGMMVKKMLKRSIMTIRAATRPHSSAILRSSTSRSASLRSSAASRCPWRSASPRARCLPSP